MNNRARWRMGALASAVALLSGLTSLDASALGLGRITVQSALGEPLRAEIDIVEINASEAASLKAGVASAEAFKAAGLEYTSAVVGMRVSLQKRADGQIYLQLTSPRPVTEPFVDLVLEAVWSSGRVLRDYTMLFDPPNLRQSNNAASINPTAPQLSRPTLPVEPPAARSASVPYSPPASIARATPAKPIQPPKPALAKAPSSGQQIKVKPGDTAGKLAAQNKPASISLDQMLVALLRSNPDAFIGGNVNRIKSGAVLNLPAADEAVAVSTQEATRTVTAQSRDFNEFRRKLAESTPATQIGNANRQAGGKLQAQVEDRAPATATPDKLTLSKGAVQSKAAAEDKIAKDRQAKEAADRVSELSKNIGDLNKLASPASTGSAAKAASAGIALAKPDLLPLPPASAAITASTTSSTTASLPQAEATSVAATSTTAAMAAVTPASAPVAVASAPAQAAAASGTASAPATAMAKKRVALPPPPEPSLIDTLNDNPFVWPGLAGLLVLLAGLGLYRYKKRQNGGQVDSSFLESRLQPDSFFGASGGQRIDTNEGGATGSSLVYSPSQLDAAGDVDPVAEADVYLAYGRDLQAEEILKEAIRTTPTRVAIHAKLMEIYAKRRDIKAFEVVALEAFNLTGGDGPEWAYIGEMGRDLDPGNPMYQPGGQPHAATHAVASNAQFDAAAFGSSTLPQVIDPASEEPSSSVDFDLDLDFSLGDETAASIPPSPVAPRPVYAPQAAPPVALKAAPDRIFDSFDMDFSLDAAPVKPALERPPASRADAPSNDDMTLSANGLSFTPEPPATATKAAPVPVVPAPDGGMLEFDLGSLSLELNGPVTESPGITAAAPGVTAVAPAALNDPLETKFELAEEFRALGDMDGARALAEEVASQAQGSLKSKAQAFLNALS